jgi:NitT/TauT family transport system substrate-binding protein
MSIALWLAATVASAATITARAEATTVHIAQQFGITYLPLMYMEHEKLLEKHAKQQGLGELTVEWVQFGSGTGMNDALLSGHLDFASGGLGPFITLWAKTRGNLEVKGVCAMNDMPLYLNTRDATVHSLRDLSAKDKIALPAIKVSFQALNLEMAAAKEFGPDHYDKLDGLTVSMKHPDGMAALLSGANEITAHFTSPPFQYQELEHAGIHKVLDSYSIVGGPHTFTVVWASGKFREQNPGIYKAFLAAFNEAIDEINRDKAKAADHYIEWTKYRGRRDLVLKVLNDPLVTFTTTPHRIQPYADFMHRIGSIKVKAASWKDLFFPEAQALAGS